MPDEKWYNKKVKVTGEVTLKYETTIDFESIQADENINQLVYQDLIGRGINEVEVTDMPDFQDFEFEVIETKEI